MARRLYVEDTCALKEDSFQIGVVDRTHSDVASHHIHIKELYSDGVVKHPGVRSRLYDEFMISGVPPPNHVIVTFWFAASGFENPSELIQEDQLVLIDRALLIGDVVKRSPQDAMSGTVVRSSVSVTLAPPRHWPSPGTLRNIDAVPSNWGNFITNPDNFLSNVPVEELLEANEYIAGSFIIYQDWIGRILRAEDDVALRLGNGSVVVLDDPTDLLGDFDLDKRERSAVGDFLKTTKGNLRRGIWKYGAYDANVDPSGCVADVQVVGVEVEWLGRRYGLETTTTALSAEPPEILQRDILESGDVVFYDETMSSTLIPASRLSASAARIITDEISVADRVQFRDLESACAKHDKLRRIPRNEALGFDINVFIVTSTESTVTVRWQDLTTSELKSTELVPNVDLDDEDEVWPGEIIVSRSELPDSTMATDDTEEAISHPTKVGVVQYVNARDRLASVKWFPDGSVRLTGPYSRFLLPDSVTGKCSDDAEDVSLYDIWTVKGLTRRLGDMVIILPPEISRLRAASNGHPESEDPRQVDWFGEVVELGLDGLLTVRLGGTSPIREVRVHVEGTIIAHGIDQGHDTDSDTDSDDHTEDDDMNEDLDHLAAFNDGPYVEFSIEYEGGQPLEGHGSEDTWSTASEEADGGDVEMTDAGHVEEQKHTQPDIEQPVLADEYNVSVSNQEVHTTDPPDSAVGAVNMDAKLQPELTELVHFAILDSPPPIDHKWLNSNTTTASGQRLRRILKEHSILQDSLPEGVFVRTWESRLDLLRVLIIGPADTPYEFAPFVIDFALDGSFPVSPPQAHFHSWTDGSGAINPNLYEQGTVCLSLLGTWAGHKNERWSDKDSTLLQIFVSLLGLVLVEEPYYNEAGFEVRTGTIEAQLPSALYSERTYFRSRSFIAHALQHPVAGFSQEITALYTRANAGDPQLLLRAISTALDVVRRSRHSPSTDANQLDLASAEKGRRVSAGALIPLRRQLAVLIELLMPHDPQRAAVFQETLQSA